MHTAPHCKMQSVAVLIKEKLLQTSVLWECSVEEFPCSKFLLSEMTGGT